MSQKTLDSRPSIESCTFQLHSWRPFQLHQTLDSSDPLQTQPKRSSTNGFLSKRPCLPDRTTSFSIDLSRLTLLDEDNQSNNANAPNPNRGSYRLLARKRRRRGSRSVSGRSSDRSGTRRCCSVGASAAYGTCSDFPVAVGTDSSGELFVNGGDAYWASDVSEARISRREKGDGGSGEKENLGGQFGGYDAQGNESGYGSEPGYRGDGEFGYGDEVEEEEEDARLLFWGDQFGDTDSKMEIVGENTFADQKAHHRCRRKKHDHRMVDSLNLNETLTELKNTSHKPYKLTGDGETMLEYANLVWDLHHDRDKASHYFEQSVEATPENSHKHMLVSCGKQKQKQKTMITQGKTTHMFLFSM